MAYFIIFFFLHILMKLNVRFFLIGSLKGRNIILNSVRQHNYFITQCTYVGYMFRLSSCLFFVI